MMNRTVRSAILADAIFLGTTFGAAAHTITVEPNGVTHPLATGTPRMFDADYNNVGDGGTRSAASHGTNTACEAIPEHAAVTITGGTCGS